MPNLKKTLEKLAKKTKGTMPYVAAATVLLTASEMKSMQKDNEQKESEKIENISASPTQKTEYFSDTDQSNWSLYNGLPKDVTYKDDAGNTILKHFFEKSASGEYSWAETTLEDGVANGEERIFVKNKLLRKTIYKNGKKNGLEKNYKENGTVDFETTFKDGKKDGPETFYTDQGKPFWVNNYKKDVPADGVWKGYKDWNFDNDWLAQADFYKGNLYDRFYKNGKLSEGVYEETDSNGWKKEITYGKDGIKNWIYEHDNNGKLRTRQHYWPGLESSPQTEHYNADGMIEKRDFDDHTVFYKNGKESHDVYRDENGNILWENFYNDGVPADGIHKQFWKNLGRLETSYKDGKKNGSEKYFDKNNNFVGENIYKNGQPIGDVRDFFLEHVNIEKSTEIASKYENLSQQDNIKENLQKDVNEEINRILKISKNQRN